MESEQAATPFQNAIRSEMLQAMLSTIFSYVIKPGKIGRCDAMRFFRVLQAQDQEPFQRVILDLITTHLCRRRNRTYEHVTCDVQRSIANPQSNLTGDSKSSCD